jgi:hypothetical protein
VTYAPGKKALPFDPSFARDFEKKVYPDTGHFIHTDNPVEYAADVVDFRQCRTVSACGGPAGQWYDHGRTGRSTGAVGFRAFANGWPEQIERGADAAGESRRSISRLARMG